MQGAFTVEDNLISRLAQHASQFSKGQRRIAQYIEEHYETAAFMTAYRLGETVGVSESTVVRFAAELGFEGYPQLQKAMQKLTRSRLTSVQRVEVARARMTDDEVADAVMSYDISNIRQTLEELPRERFRQAVDALVSARRVYIFGAGSCRALANFLAFYLNLLLPDVKLISASGEAEILEEIIHIGEQDAMVGISFPRYSTRSATALHFAKSRRAQVIAITDSMMSPIAQLADCCLLAHSDMATIVDSLVAPMSVINALLVAVSLKRMDENHDTLGELERLWETYQVYQPFPQAEPAEET